MRGSRFFASKAEASAFAKAQASEVHEMESWNPMREFGYRWQVDYQVDPPPSRAK